MKSSTRNVIKSFPSLEKHLVFGEKFEMNLHEIQVNEGLDQVEYTFLKLICFFEYPEDFKFQLHELYKNLDDDWLLLALESINMFFEKDTYLMKNAAHSVIKEGDDYLNQKEFVDFLNDNEQNYSEAKMSVYIQRKVIPSPDLVISNTRYWLKS